MNTHSWHDLLQGQDEAITETHQPSGIQPPDVNPVAEGLMTPRTIPEQGSGPSIEGERSTLVAGRQDTDVPPPSVPPPSTLRQRQGDQQQQQVQRQTVVNAPQDRNDHHRNQPSRADHGLTLVAAALVIGILAILFRKMMAAVGAGQEGSRDLEWSL